MYQETIRSLDEEAALEGAYADGASDLWPPTDSDLGIALRQVVALERIADALEKLGRGDFSFERSDFSWLGDWSAKGESNTR